MNAKDFQRIALSLEGAEEGSHMGAVDFRVGGRIFATLAAEKQGYGNLLLTPEQQATFVEELPEGFLPIHGAGEGMERRMSGWRWSARTCWQGRCAQRGSCVSRRTRKRERRRKGKQA